MTRFSDEPTRGHILITGLRKMITCNWIGKDPVQAFVVVITVHK
jgi:hypothetical protein